MLIFEMLHKLIIECRSSGKSINKTAEILGCSPSMVKSVWSSFNKNKGKI